MLEVLLKLLFYLSTAGFYVYCVYYSVNFIKIPNDNDKVFGKTKYLTFLNLGLQCAYFCLVTLLIIPEQKFTKLKRMRDVLFLQCATLSFIVVFLFWALYLFDRELVYPEFLDGVIPTWYNHAVHSVVGLTALLEVFVSRPKPPFIGFGLSLLLSLVAGYLCWIFYIKEQTNFWVYPVLEYLSPSARTVFIGCGVVSCCCFYCAIHFLAGLIQQYKDTDSHGATKMKNASNHRGYLYYGGQGRRGVGRASGARLKKTH